MGRIKWSSYNVKKKINPFLHIVKNLNVLWRLKSKLLLISWPLKLRFKMANFKNKKGWLAQLTWTCLLTFISWNFVHVSKLGHVTVFNIHSLQIWMKKYGCWWLDELSNHVFFKTFFSIPRFTVQSKSLGTRGKSLTDIDW